jgi:hypothetical protein
VFLVFVWIAILRTDDRLVLRTLGAGALRRMTGGGQATA